MSRVFNGSNGNSNVKGKASMYLKKNFDSDIPSNIMTLISMWIDCYNSTISEKTKIKGHFEFENKINDTEFMTSSIKMSSSGKRSENEKIKHEKEIFNWLSLQEDKDIDFFSTKISKLMLIDKNVIISAHVNHYRVANNKKAYNPDYKKPFIKPAPTPFIKSEPLPKVEVPKIEKKEEKVYKDAWDDHFS